MAQNARFEFEFQGDHRRRPAPPPPLPTTTATNSPTHTTTTFSQLLFGPHDDQQDHDALALDLGHTFNHHHNDKLPKMLCFGRDDNADAADDQEFLFGNAGVASTPPPQRSSVVTCTDSCSSVSSVNNKTTAGAPHHKSKPTNKKRGGNLETATVTTGSQGGGSKKSKPEKGAAKGHVKVRKERLGERIAALQQLVSPFGKTDTASVLHEAMGYIRFLQEQVQVLCSPYLQPLPAATEGGENGAQGEERRGLRSRGLCLVPLACTVHVASTNGADFWSPAMANNATI